MRLLRGRIAAYNMHLRSIADDARLRPGGPLVHAVPARAERVVAGPAAPDVAVAPAGGAARVRGARRSRSPRTGAMLPAPAGWRPRRERRGLAGGPPRGRPVGEGVPGPVGEPPPARHLLRRRALPPSARSSAAGLSDRPIGSRSAPGRRPGRWPAATIRPATIGAHQIQTVVRRALGGGGQAAGQQAGREQAAPAERGGGDERDRHRRPRVVGDHHRLEERPQGQRERDPPEHAGQQRRRPGVVGVVGLVAAGMSGAVACDIPDIS